MRTILKHKQTMGYPKYVVLLPIIANIMSPVTTAFSTCYSGGGCRNHEGRDMTHGQGPILDILNQHGDRRFYRPGLKEGRPTQVTVDMYINSFDSINVDNMDYVINVYMRQRWVDERLVYSHIYPNISRITVDYRLFDEIWTPDIFFPNEKHSNSHCVTVPNAMIRLYPNGSVLYSSRYTLTMACHMDLHRFPLDSQECHMRVESYGYTEDEMELHWHSEEPVQLNDDLTLPKFDLAEDPILGECHTSYVVGSFTCLKATFKLERQYGYFMLQTYVPSLLIVVLSWVSFWISIDAVPARISLGVLTVLTLTTQSIGVWMSLPQVSYVKAIDIWMAMCIFMVFSAMLEFAIVNTNARKEIRQQSIREREKQKAKNMPDSELARMMLMEFGGSGLTGSRYDQTSRLLARRLDKISRWAFPAAFIIFNVVYWPLFML